MSQAKRPQIGKKAKLKRDCLNSKCNGLIAFNLWQIIEHFRKGYNTHLKYKHRCNHCDSVWWTTYYFSDGELFIKDEGFRKNSWSGWWGNVNEGISYSDDSVFNLILED